jgi:hypothetical protein
MRRAQITLFLLVGLLMLIAFGFVFFITDIETTTKGRTSIHQVSQSALGKPTVEYYMRSCMDTATLEGLELIGMQGGLIYESQAAGTKRFLSYDRPPFGQYGRFVVPFRYKGIIHNMSFGIRRSASNPISVDSHRNVPWYPYPGYLVPEPLIDGNPLINAFGNYEVSFSDKVSNLPPLCYTDGANDPRIQGFQFSCESYSQNPQQTVQYYLEQYIANRTDRCVNVSVFEEKGYNLTKEGAAKAVVLFGEDDLLVRLHYPIRVSIPGGSSTVHISNYTSRYPFRLKKVYELAQHMVREDVRNIFFDYTNESAQLYLNDCLGFNQSSGKRELRDRPCLYPGMSIRHHRDVCLMEGLCETGAYSDVVAITDSMSGTGSYTFAFGVENRVPALEPLDESVGPGTSYYQDAYVTYALLLNESYSKLTTSPPLPENYNVVAEVEQRLELFPRALDPEEDALTYHYTGWKTGVSILNRTQEYTYSYYDATGLHVRAGEEVSGGTGLVNWWEMSSSYRQGYMPGLTDRSKDADYPPAPYTLDADDVGYHWIRINVSDNDGSYDWQDVTIQVRCIPDGEQCCINESDYHYLPQGTVCNTCHTCQTNGSRISCMVDLAIDQCPPCERCETDGSCGGYPNDPRCVGSSGDDGVCCPDPMGGMLWLCIDLGSMVKPWQVYGKCRECYIGECVAGEYIYYPKAEGSHCTGGPSGGSCDGNGVCTDGVYTYVEGYSGVCDIRI